jgi:hypothetical protein
MVPDEKYCNVVSLMQPGRQQKSGKYIVYLDAAGKQQKKQLDIQ